MIYKGQEMWIRAYCAALTGYRSREASCHVGASDVQDECRRDANLALEAWAENVIQGRNKEWKQ